MVSRTGQLQTDKALISESDWMLLPSQLCGVGQAHGSQLTNCDPRCPARYDENLLLATVVHQNLPQMRDKFTVWPEFQPKSAMCACRWRKPAQ